MKSRRNFIKGAVWAASSLWLPRAFCQNHSPLDTGFWGVIAAQIPNANLIYWFDANQIGGADGVGVALWPDISGNSNHAIQNTTANKPILKKNIINGNAVVRFNNPSGTTNFMTLPSAMGAPASGEMFAVFKSAADPSAGSTVIGLLNLQGINAGDANPFSDGTIYETFGAKFNNHTAIAKTPNLASAFHALNVNAEANHYPIKIDGQYVYVDTTNVVSFTNTLRFISTPDSASGGFWRGDIAEIIVYATTLTVTQRQAVQNYLAGKYGISFTSALAQTLPTGISGLVGWWKVDDLSLNDGDPVSTWSDASGSGNTLTQAGATRPTFKTAVLNGKNAVRFTTAQNLTLAGDLTIAASQPLSLVAITAPTGDCVITGHSVDNWQFRVNQGAVNQLSEFPNGTGQSISQTYTTPLAGPYACLWRRIGTNSVGSMFQNGIASTGGNVTSTAQCRIRTIGGGIAALNYQGDLSEICLYSGNSLTNAQWAALYDTYLRSRWGLP